MRVTTMNGDGETGALLVHEGEAIPVPRRAAEAGALLRSLDLVEGVGRRSEGGALVCLVPVDSAGWNEGASVTPRRDVDVSSLSPAR